MKNLEDAEVGYGLIFQGTPYVILESKIFF